MVVFLGHVVSAASIAVDLAKVEVVTEMRVAYFSDQDINFPRLSWILSEVYTGLLLLLGAPLT